MKQLFNISLADAPRYAAEPDVPSAFFDLIKLRHRLLSAAWKEHVGHTNPNKSAALVLPEALELGKRFGEQIRALQS